ncbi:DUF6798 domain-containing protein [Pirellulaceae bacterium SH467]
MTMQPEHPKESGKDVRVRSNGWFWIDFLATFVVFWLYAGNQIPDVNEPHYWSKAAHFWNSSLGKGDLFLESGDAHWAFFATFGWLTTVLPIQNAIGAGRFLTWLSLAGSWTYLLHGVLRRSVSPDSHGSAISPAPKIFAVLAAPVWLAGMHWGNWAGEWVVGGCESKGVAYAFFFFGLGSICRSRWTLGWGMIGLGSLFHVVTGLWVIATVGLASIWLQLLSDRLPIQKWLRAHLVGWILGASGFVAGAVPAIQMDFQTGSDAKSQAAVAQVYTRLGHHLSPTRFSETRWRGFSALLAISSAVLLLAHRSRWASHKQPDAPIKGVSLGHLIHAAPERVRWLLAIASISFLVAMTGLAIDLLLSPWAPKFAASILRYYWFRWNEVTWPLALAIVVLAIATRRLGMPPGERLLGLSGESWVRIVSLSAFGFSIGLINERVQSHAAEVIPAGDKQSFSLKEDTQEIQREQFAHWLAVCEWIRTETPREGLWLTPRRQQTFKWRAQRPELASWKDMPQNASAVVLWNERLQAAYRYDDLKRLLPNDETKLKELIARYGIRYVLLDLRVEGQTIPAWKQLYPIAPNQNPYFVVLEAPTDPAPAETSASTPSL